MSVYSDRELQQSDVVNSPLPSRFPEITGLDSAPEPKAAPSDTVRREIDRLARQTEGISKALKRLKDAV